MSFDVEKTTDIPVEGGARFCQALLCGVKATREGFFCEHHRSMLLAHGGAGKLDDVRALVPVAGSLVPGLKRSLLAWYEAAAEAVEAVAIAEGRSVANQFRLHASRIRFQNDPSPQKPAHYKPKAVRP